MGLPSWLWWLIDLSATHCRTFSSGVSFSNGDSLNDSNMSNKVCEHSSEVTTFTSQTRVLHLTFLATIQVPVVLERQFYKLFSMDSLLRWASKLPRSWQLGSKRQREGAWSRSSTCACAHRSQYASFQPQLFVTAGPWESQIISIFPDDELGISGDVVWTPPRASLWKAKEKLGTNFLLEHRILALLTYSNEYTYWFLGAK